MAISRALRQYPVLRWSEVNNSYLRRNFTSRRCWSFPQWMTCKGSSSLDLVSMGRVTAQLTTQSGKERVWILLFIGPESDHWQCLSVTDSLTHWLTHSVTFSKLDGFEWCQLPCDVVTVFWVGKWLCNLSTAGKGRQTPGRWSDLWLCLSLTDSLTPV